MFKKLGLAVIGVSMGVSAGYAGEFGAELPAFAALKQGAQAVKAMPQAPAPVDPSWRTAVDMMQDDFSELARESYDSDKYFFMDMAGQQIQQMLAGWPAHHDVVLGYQRLLQALDKKYAADADFFDAVRLDKSGVKALAAQYQDAPSFLTALDQLIAQLGGTTNAGTMTTAVTAPIAVCTDGSGTTVDLWTVAPNVYAADVEQAKAGGSKSAARFESLTESAPAAGVMGGSTVYERKGFKLSIVRTALDEPGTLTVPSLGLTIKLNCK